MSTDRLDELITLAALGELSDADERELDRLLADDADAASELRSTLDTAAAVQATLAEPPPPALRDRLLAATANVPQLPADVPVADEPSEAVEAGAVLVDLASRRRRRVGSFVAAAAAALVLVVGAAVIVTNDDSGGGDPIAAVLDADDVQFRVLEGELQGLQAAYSPSLAALVIEGDGVRSPNGDNTFEAWRVTENGPIPIGVFGPDGAGRVEQRFDDVELDGFVLAVTEEPAGGSETPTLPILASA